MILHLLRYWNSRRLFILVVLFIPLSAIPLFAAQIVFPNIGIIGQRIGGERPMWSATNGDILPKQIAIDYNRYGRVYGFKCEYVFSTNHFQELRLKIQNEMQVKAIVDTNNIVIWRSNQRKITAELAQGEEAGELNLIVVSLDKAVRD